MARILDPADSHDHAFLDRLRHDPVIEFIDERENQFAELRGLLPPPADDVLTEPFRWAYYPWRRTVVAVLGPRGFRSVRLDRNRNVITVDEQQRLGTLCIGVAGLSVGHVIAHTLAAEGLCGELRLADFDHLALSNLNRVPATVLDIGLNKAEVAARRIAELDPYLHVRVLEDGLTPDTVDGFLDGLDIVVEECDSLDIKAIIRERARARGIPVLMATSDRGMVDVERFDLEPDRPILHGLLGDADPASLAGMTSKDKIPLLLRFLEAADSSPRGAASLLEVGRTLSTWPQVCGDVAAGAPAVAEAVRRLGLGEPLRSGRTRLDVGRALDGIYQPEAPAGHSGPENWSDPELSGVPGDIVAAAMRAPSASNAQPWHIDASSERIVIELAPEHTSTLDLGYRASAVALGAALFNARVAAAARQVLGPVELSESEDRSGAAQLTATLHLRSGGDEHLAGLYDAMVARETNRRLGTSAPLGRETAQMLRDAAEREGATLHLLTGQGDIGRAAAILASADRARYLTPLLHAEMVAELRWPGDPRPETGIDVRTLELESGELSMLDILRRPDVMEYLAIWNAGAALGDDARRRMTSSSAVGVVSVPGGDLADYVVGGSAAEAVWVTAQKCGLATQPVSPIFLYANSADETTKLSAAFSDDLVNLRAEFGQLADIGPSDHPALVLRFAVDQSPSSRSRRSFDRIRLR